MRAKLIFESLNEYLEINSKGTIEGNMAYNFDDMIEAIDRTKGEEFTPEDFSNFLEFLIEVKTGASNSINLIKYLFNMHPEMQEDIINDEGPFKEMLDAYMELMTNKDDQSGMDYGERYN